jgi:hypothetical protein
MPEGSCKPSMLDVTRLGSQERYVDLGKAPQAEPRHLSRLTRSLRKREKIFNSYASQTGMRSLWQYWPSSTSARRETSESISGIEFDPDNFCRSGLKERDIGRIGRRTFTSYGSSSAANWIRSSLREFLRRLVDTDFRIHSSTTFRGECQRRCRCPPLHRLSPRQRATARPSPVSTMLES